MISSIVSGITSAISSSIAGNDTEQIMTDALMSMGMALVGSGIQLVAGRVIAGRFIKNASNTKLKTLANSMGYRGREFKSSAKWTGKIMLDASKQFSNEIIPNLVGKTMSFISGRLYNARTLI